MDNLNKSAQKDENASRGKRDKKFWLWGCSGCLALLLVVCIIVGGVLYTVYGPPALNGEISVPTKIKQGDEFDIVITLTNSTAKSVFIKDIAFQNFLNNPTLLNGASVIKTLPDMQSDHLNETDVLFHYFRDIRPGETQTFTFHMKANHIGVYAGDIGIYAKHPFLGAPFFQNAQYFSDVQIEITP